MVNTIWITSLMISQFPSMIQLVPAANACNMNNSIQHIPLCWLCNLVQDELNVLIFLLVCMYIILFH